MKIVAGGIPLAEDFYSGRMPVVKELEKELKNNDVLVLGPRRTGKTSVIKEYLRINQAADPNFKSAYIDLESVQDLYEFYLRVIKDIYREAKKWKHFADGGVAFAKKLSTGLAKVFPGADIEIGEYIGAPGTKISFKLPTFEPKKIELLAQELQLVLKDLGTSFVLVLDEFPELIWKFGKELEIAEQGSRRKEMTKLLMEGFRSIRQEKDGIGVRIIIAGSVNLQNTLKYLELEQTINDLKRIQIPYLTPTQSVELISNLLNAEKISIKDPEYLNDLVSQQFGTCSPFYIQLFAELIKHISIYQDRTITNDDLLTCYQKIVVHERGPNYLRTRINRYYSGSEEIVKIILKTMAEFQFKNGKHCPENLIQEAVGNRLDREHFTGLLHKLHSDDLIGIHQPKTYGFESQLICNFWNYNLVDGEYIHAS